VHLGGALGIGAVVLLLAGVSMAGPAPDASADDETTDRGPDTRAVPGLRQRLESGMQELGELAQSARSDTDLVRAQCVLDKQERAQGVMEVATGELLLLGDSGATQEQKSFAVEKLAAATDRLDGLVESARTCTGDTSPEEHDDITDTDVDESSAVPVADPTTSSESPVPPPIDDSRPPLVASPSQ
jgi:hypothetical protein